MADTGVTIAALKEQLAAIQTAITNILTTGSSYSRAGLTLTHANLSDLQAREQYLIRSITRSQEGMIMVGKVDSDSETLNNFDETDDD